MGVIVYLCDLCFPGGSDDKRDLPANAGVTGDRFDPG